MTDAVKRRLFAVAALVVAMGALAYLSMGGIGENLVYYWSPTELMEADDPHGAIVRLGGQVVEGTLDWNQEKQITKFDVTDGQNVVSVLSNGNPPQMFREGIGVVVEGRLQKDGIFHSEKVMVKHSNEYQAPDGEKPSSDMYKSLVSDES